MVCNSKSQFNFTIKQGTDLIVPFRLKDSAGYLDLTGYKAAMQLRSYVASSTIEDNLSTSNGRIKIDETDGRITCSFPHEVTALYKKPAYVYDLKIISNTGQSTRVIEGKINISPEVTRVIGSEL